MLGKALNLLLSSYTPARGSWVVEKQVASSGFFPAPVDGSGQFLTDVRLCL